MTAAKQQRGVALVAVIFLIVVIGAALVVLARLSTQSNAQITQSLLQARGKQAALAAAEFGIQRLVESGSPGTLCSGWSNTTVSVPAYAAFTVQISCSQSTYQDNNPSAQFELYRLVSEAQYGNLGDPDYTWVRLESAIEL